MEIPNSYKNNIKSRSFVHYIKGFLIRLWKYSKYSFLRLLARFNGASIGPNTIIPYSLAIRCNKNLHIGEDTIIESDNFDLRSPIFIGNHCVVNKDVMIIRVSHYIDEDQEFTSRYYPDLIIEDYSWVATGSKILPSCNFIAKGTVIGAFSVIVKNTEQMGVYSGNPAKLLRTHNTLFDQKIICSMMGGDLKFYIKARESLCK